MVKHVVPFAGESCLIIIKRSVSSVAQHIVAVLDLDCQAIICQKFGEFDFTPIDTRGYLVHILSVNQIMCIHLQDTAHIIMRKGALESFVVQNIASKPCINLDCKHSNEAISPHGSFTVVSCTCGHIYSIQESGTFDQLYQTEYYLTSIMRSETDLIGFRPSLGTVDLSFQVAKRPTLLDSLTPHVGNLLISTKFTRGQRQVLKFSNDIDLLSCGQTEPFFRGMTSIGGLRRYIKDETCDLLFVSFIASTHLFLISSDALGHSVMEDVTDISGIKSDDRTIAMANAPSTSSFIQLTGKYICIGKSTLSAGDSSFCYPVAALSGCIVDEFVFLCGENPIIEIYKCNTRGQTGISKSGDIFCGGRPSAIHAIKRDEADYFMLGVVISTSLNSQTLTVYDVRLADNSCVIVAQRSHAMNDHFVGDLRFVDNLDTIMVLLGSRSGNMLNIGVFCDRLVLQGTYNLGSRPVSFSNAIKTGKSSHCLLASCLSTIVVTVTSQHLSMGTLTDRAFPLYLRHKSHGGIFDIFLGQHEYLHHCSSSLQLKGTISPFLELPVLSLSNYFHLRIWVVCSIHDGILL